jgi:hypothetical protein
MSNQIITGHLEPDGSIIYVPVGFIPDFLFAVEYGVTNPLLYYWFGNEEEDAESTDGIIDTAGTKTKAAAAAGFAGYDTKTSGPYGITATPAAIADWVASTAYGARSATAHGDYVRATSTGTDTNGLVVDRSQLFECVTAGTSGSSEPTWPANIGGNSASDNGVVWQKVTDVPTFEGGYKGFSIAAALMTDAQEWYYLAIQADDTIDQEDVTSWPGGIEGM